MTERQKGIGKTDQVVSVMIRERDKDLPCIVCGKFKSSYDNGHFQPRGSESTRFHPRNCNKECVGCNRWEYSGYGKDKSFEHGIAVDEKWGKGTATMLYVLAHKAQGWSEVEMKLLRAAARKGSEEYEKIYYKLRPDHRIKKSR